MPQGHWQAGLGAAVNLPTQTSKALGDALENGIGTLYNQAKSDSVVPVAADTLNNLARALVAYSVDPLGMQTGLFVRYGMFPRLDGGYQYVGGAHAFDLRCQFLGPLAQDSAEEGGSSWQGSLGVQYSWQSYDLPSVAGLDKLQSLLGFEFKRKDVLVPIVFGKPFGKQGRYGSFGIGAAYDITFISYGSDILKLVERKSDGTTAAFAPLQGEKTISSYGGFVNIRGGYRWVYLVGSLSAYWQDYGTFDLFGGKTTSLAGWTFAPALALETRF